MSTLPSKQVEPWARRNFEGTHDLCDYVRKDIRGEVAALNAPMRGQWYWSGPTRGGYVETEAEGYAAADAALVAEGYVLGEKVGSE